MILWCLTCQSYRRNPPRTKDSIKMSFYSMCYIKLLPRQTNLIIVTRCKNRNRWASGVCKIIALGSSAALQPLFRRPRAAESKGRIERVWNTTQDRLVPELRLNGITSRLDANRYLTQVYLPEYWHTRNSVEMSLDTIFERQASPLVRSSMHV